MAYFLAKTEPHEYSIDDLQAAGVDTWDGVTNATAVINLKKMSAEDYVLIYHSGAKEIAGLAQVVGESRPDPELPKSWLRDFKFIHKFDPPIATLADIKAAGTFSEFALVRMGRLSVMEVPPEFLTWLNERGANLPG
jgi:predicted RNA-binding protein with PUA-like domain